MPKNDIWRSVSLPTLIVAICLAAVFVAANMMMSGPFLVGHSVEPEDQVTFNYHWGSFRGWPLHYQRAELHQVYPVKHTRRVAEGSPPPFVIPKNGSAELSFGDLGWHRYFPLRWSWLWPTIALAVNALIALAIIAATGAACEFLIRRTRRGARIGSDSVGEGEKQETH